MDKQKKIIFGAIIVLIAVAGTVIGINKTDLAKSKNKAKNSKAQTAERIKARNEALTYFSEAHMKAEQNDLQGANAACDKAMEIAPNEPVIMNCKNSINAMNRR